MKSALGGHKPWARKRRRLVLSLSALAVLGFATYLILQAMGDALLYFRVPSDVVADHPPAGQPFRLGGLVEDGSLIKLEDGVSIRFTVTDGDAEIPVQYTGILPDLFREGQGIIADGELDGGGVFVASRILAKHDENYMPKDVYDRIQDKGHPDTIAANDKMTDQ